MKKKFNYLKSFSKDKKSGEFLLNDVDEKHYTTNDQIIMDPYAFSSRNH